MTREEEIRQAAINHICDDTEQLLVLFEEGAKWADETIINRAIEWLTYQFNMPSDFEYNFRKAMEN